MSNNTVEVEVLFKLASLCTRIVEIICQLIKLQRKHIFKSGCKQKYLIKLHMLCYLKNVIVRMEYIYFKLLSITRIFFLKKDEQHFYGMCILGQFITVNLVTLLFSYILLPPLPHLSKFVVIGNVMVAHL